jgi:putative acetyltransferase
MHDSVVPYLTYDPMPLEEFREIYAGLLRAGKFFIYELSGQVAGFYEASRYYGRAQHVAYLGSLAVSPDLRQAVGVPRTPRQIPRFERDVRKVQALLDPEEFEKAWAEGRQMTAEQAIQLALDETRE